MAIKKTFSAISDFSIGDLPQMNEFIKKWCARHSNPYNAILHAIGIPASVAGVVMLFYLKFLTGIALILFGYALQVAGHIFEGTQVGEVMLIKKIGEKLFGKK